MTVSTLCRSRSGSVLTSTLLKRLLGDNSTAVEQHQRAALADTVQVDVGTAGVLSAHAPPAGSSCRRTRATCSRLSIRFAGERFFSSSATTAVTGVGVNIPGAWTMRDPVTLTSASWSCGCSASCANAEQRRLRARPRRPRSSVDSSSDSSSSSPLTGSVLSLCHLRDTGRIVTRT